jgi:hypothetical protein
VRVVKMAYRFPCCCFTFFSPLISSDASVDKTDIRH